MIPSPLKIIIIIGFVVRSLSQGPKKCTSYGSSSSLMANCSGIFTANDTNMTAPPTYLDKNLKVLDISRNVFDDLNDTSFVMYPKLRILIMIQVRKRIPTWGQNISSPARKDVFRFKVSVDLFKPLEDLEELDLTGTLFETVDLEFGWPPKLTILRLASMDMSNFKGLSSLAKLEEINFSNNSLRSLSSLNREAPIKVMNLNENPLDKLTVSEIAPFCQLQELGLRVRRDSALLTNPFAYCDCERLNVWVEKRDIAVEERLKCKPNKTDHFGKPDVNCSYNFDEDNKVYEHCTSKLGITSWELLLYAIFFSVLFPILYFGFDTYSRFAQARADNKDTGTRGRSSKISKAGDSKSSLAGETPNSDYDSSFYDHDPDHDDHHDSDHHEDHDHDHDHHHDHHRQDHDRNHPKGSSESIFKPKHGSEVKKK